MRKFMICIAFAAIIFSNAAPNVRAQNIFSGERVQVVGSFNGYATTPYGTDYRTNTYRRVSTQTGTPVDGRGQWTTTINVQNSGGDVTPINMPGGGGNGFLFISGPAANRYQNKWVFSGVGQGTVNGFNNISCFNCGNDMGLNMSSPGFYTFVFNDAGYTQTNAFYYVGFTTNVPVTVTRASQTINPGGSVTVNISTSATPSSQELIYVRYTNGSDFSGAGTSSVAQATGSGTSYSVTIPAQTAGQTIRYYVFTSTLTLAQLSLSEGFSKLAPAATEADKSLGVLRYDDSAGANYTFLAPTAAGVTVAGFVREFDGRPIARARVMLTATDGSALVARTNDFGRFSFESVEIGRSYILTASAKGRTFVPQAIHIVDEVRELNLTANY